MKKNLYFINILLTMVTALVCLASLIVRTFLPGIPFPRPDVPLLVLMAVIPMIIEYYAVPDIQRNRIVSVILAGVTLTVLPLCAGWGTSIQFWKLFIAGAAVFGMTDILYGSICRRISSGKYKKAAPVINGLLLYLAAFCFQGLL